MSAHGPSHELGVDDTEGQTTGELSMSGPGVDLLREDTSSGSPSVETRGDLERTGVDGAMGKDEGPAKVACYEFSSRLVRLSVQDIPLCSQAC